MTPIESGCAQPAVEVLRLQPGPAWRPDVPWPAGEHTIPMRSLPPDDRMVSDDTAIAATSLSNGATFALVRRHAGGFAPLFEAEVWLHEMKYELYRPEHVRPLSARLPFHYHRLPGIARNALATLVLSLSGGRATFPAQLLDCGPLLIITLLDGDTARRTPPVAVLTHDIDTAAALPWVDGIATAEEEMGARSCWNVVPRHYDIDYAQIKRLARLGHEIGLHGIWHTNREAFLSRQALARELDALADLRSRFAIRTYRGPSWYRTQAMFDVLEGYFDTDLTTLDTDLLCPGGPGGVGVARPFRIRPDLVELPCTLPFEAPLLIGPPVDNLVSFWRPKIKMLKHAGGMVVVNTHPDPNYLGNPAMLEEYRGLLAFLADDGWIFKLPRDIGTT
jgi:peptidoglycan/xylan/chitin deacetylase (PgdA/CDA1 family)